MFLLRKTGFPFDHLWFILVLATAHHHVHTRQAWSTAGGHSAGRNTGQGGRRLAKGHCTNTEECGWGSAHVARYPALQETMSGENKQGGREVERPNVLEKTLERPLIPPTGRGTLRGRSTSSSWLAEKRKLQRAMLTHTHPRSVTGQCIDSLIPSSMLIGCA